MCFLPLFESFRASGKGCFQAFFKAFPVDAWFDACMPLHPPCRAHACSWSGIHWIGNGHAGFDLARPMGMWCNNCLVPIQEKQKRRKIRKKSLSAFGPPLRYQENRCPDLIVLACWSGWTLYPFRREFWLLGHFFCLNSLILIVTFDSIRTLILFLPSPERWQIEHYCCPYNCAAFDSLERKDYKRITEIFSQRNTESLAVCDFNL